MLTLVQNKIKKMFEPSLKVRIMPLKKQIELGTDYAGYVIPEYLLNRNSVYYSVGAGEDISLDIEIANRYNPTIHIFDPTPRSKAHFEITKENALNDKPNIISKKYQYPTAPKTFLKTVFEEIGVWNEKTTLKFFQPANDAHVSHSITNLQTTEKYLEVSVDTLSNIMRERNHTEIDMLKMDIEGAEFAVVRDIFDKKIPIKFICLEYHRQGKTPIKDIQASIDLFEANDYVAIAADINLLEFSFLRRDVYDKLNF